MHHDLHQKRHRHQLQIELEKSPPTVITQYCTSTNINNGAHNFSLLSIKPGLFLLFNYNFNFKLAAQIKNY